MDSKMIEEKGITYNSRVLIGNWYEASKIEEYKSKMLFTDPLNKGDKLLTRFRKMTEHLNAPTVLTQSTGTINFGDRISLLAPYVPATPPPREDAKGLLLGGRISSDELRHTTELRDGCSVVTYPEIQTVEKTTFVITSPDYCNRKSDILHYNQDFLLTLSCSVDKKPLHVRYDLNPFPGLCGKYPLYLSEHAVSSTRWRVLPVQRPDFTRFEQEGKTVPVNTDVIINHCSTNINLGVNSGVWVRGFYGKLCAPLMKTCLDVYGRELPNNIWHIHVPLTV